MFVFLLNYIRRIKLDLDWRKLLRKNPEKPFLLFKTPSDIVCKLTLIKNGMAMWEHVRRLEDNPMLVEKKLVSLFTKGEGQKRESGKAVWNKKGVKYYHATERNWKEIYSNKEEFLDLCNK